MRKKEKKESRFFSILIAIAGVCAGVWYLLRASNQIISALMGYTFPDFEITHRFAYPNLIGGIHAKDISIEYDGEVALTANSLNIEVPLTDWIKILTTRREYQRAEKISSFTVKLNDTQSNGWDILFDNYLFDPYLVGENSGSLLEADGCEVDGMWLHSELQDMGLSSPTTHFMYSFQHNGYEMEETTRVSTSNSSAVTLQSVYSASEESSIFNDEDQEINRMRLTVQDQGFVRARNAFCASKDGVKTNIVRARHLAVAKRVLKSYGLKAPDNLVKAYSEFLSEGGTFDIEADFSNADWEKVNSLTGLLRVMTTQFSNGGTGTNFRFELTPVKEWPNPDIETDSGSSFQHMVLEGSMPQHLIGATAATNTEQTDPGDSAPTKPNESNEPPQSELTESEPVESDNRVGSNESSSKPATEAKVAAVNSAELTPPPKELRNFTDLGNHIDRYVWLYRNGHDPEFVRILAIERDGARFERRYSSGSIDFLVNEYNFIKATFKSP